MTRGRFASDSVYWRLTLKFSRRAASGTWNLGKPVSGGPVGCNALFDPDGGPATTHARVWAPSPGRTAARRRSRPSPFNRIEPEAWGRQSPGPVLSPTLERRRLADV